MAAKLAQSAFLAGLYQADKSLCAIAESLLRDSQNCRRRRLEITRIPFRPDGPTVRPTSIIIAIRDKSSSRVPGLRNLAAHLGLGWPDFFWRPLALDIVVSFNQYKSSCQIFST